MRRKGLELIEVLDRAQGERTILREIKKIKKKGKFWWGGKFRILKSVYSFVLYDCESWVVNSVSGGVLCEVLKLREGIIMPLCRVLMNIYRRRVEMRDSWKR